MAPFAFSQVSSADFIEMGRHLGQLQRELHSVRNREEERDRRTELSLEAIEALIGAREEDSDRRFQEQAQENADRISKVRCGRFRGYKLQGCKFTYIYLNHCT